MPVGARTPAALALRARGSVRAQAGARRWPVAVPTRCAWGACCDRAYRPGSSWRAVLTPVCLWHVLSVAHGVARQAHAQLRSPSAPCLPTQRSGARGRRGTPDHDVSFCVGELLRVQSTSPEIVMVLLSHFEMEYLSF